MVVFILNLHLIHESRQCLGVYTFRNILFNNDRYHSNVISYFPLFSEAELAHGSPPDRRLESSHESEGWRGAHHGLHVRGGELSKTPPAETHRHSLGLGKPRTAPVEASIGRA